MKDNYSVETDVPKHRLYFAIGVSALQVKDDKPIRGQKPIYCAVLTNRKGVTTNIPILSLCLEKENAMAIVRTTLEIVSDETRELPITVFCREQAVLQNLCGFEPRILKWRANGGKKANNKPVNGFIHYDAMYKLIEAGHVVITLPEGEAVWCEELLGKADKDAQNIRELGLECMLADDEVMMGTDLEAQIRNRLNTN